MADLPIVTVVGNPKPGSRTLTASTTLSAALADRLRLAGSEPEPVEPIDLAELADGLLAPWRLSAAATDATEKAREAGILVLATPTYKASFTGLLKLFLDTLPAGSLSRTVVVPLTVAGGPAHRHLADLQLRPVLAELGAAVPAPSLLLEESELTGLPGIVDDYLDRHASVLAATALALRALVATPS